MPLSDDELRKLFLESVEAEPSDQETKKIETMIEALSLSAGAADRSEQTRAMYYGTALDGSPLKTSPADACKHLRVHVLEENDFGRLVECEDCGEQQLLESSQSKDANIQKRSHD